LKSSPFGELFFGHYFRILRRVKIRQYHAGVFTFKRLHMVGLSKGDEIFQVVDF